MAFIIALIKYTKCAKSKKPKMNIRKIAIIKKYKINKKTLYELTPRKSLNDNLNILYFHGGAYSGGISRVHWNFIKKILEDTCAKIFIPDYPIVPKNTYKEVFDMADEIYNTYLPKSNFIIIGDSAGGGISLAFSQKLGEENKKMPEKIILISPWLDISLKNKEIDNIQEKDDVLNKKVLKLAGSLYCGKNNPNDYLVSPINGPTDKIKNVVIFTGTYDILNPDVSLFKEKIETQKLVIYEKKGAKHNWILEIDKDEEDYQNLIKILLNIKKGN